MIYTIENRELRVSVNSQGAELYSIYDKTLGRERLWQADPALWPRRAPIVFPLTARLKNDTYMLDGKPYSMPLHGFGRDIEHTLVELSGSSLRLRLENSSVTEQLYPFQFTFDSVLTLEENTLIHTFEITNRSQGDMPFSAGFHTGYLCPFDEEHAIEDYRLVFETAETCQRTVTALGTLLVKGKEPYLIDSSEIRLHNQLFQPNICFENLKSSKVSLVEQDTGRSITLDYTGFPTLVLWSAANRVKFVCIEPWHGCFEPPEDYGDLFHRPGIRSLAPGERFTCSTRATFDNNRLPLEQQ